jgi:hypothetical protein
MFKRLFFATVGLGAGVALGVWAVRKVEATQAKLTPEHAARVTAARAEGIRGRVTEALTVGRLAAAEKEAELRAIYRVQEQRRAEARVPPSGPPTGARPAGAPGTADWPPAAGPEPA